MTITLGRPVSGMFNEGIIDLSTGNVFGLSGCREIDRWLGNIAYVVGDGFLADRYRKVDDVPIIKPRFVKCRQCILSRLTLIFHQLSCQIRQRIQIWIEGSSSCFISSICAAVRSRPFASSVCCAIQ